MSGNHLETPLGVFQFQTSRVGKVFPAFCLFSKFWADYLTRQVAGFSPTWRSCCRQLMQ